MKFKYISFFLIFFFLFAFNISYAQNSTLNSNKETFEKAKVLDILDSGTTTPLGTDTIAPSQSLKVLILNGVDSGQTITFKNDYIQLIKGQTFYIHHIVNNLDDSENYWSVADPYRLNILLELTIVFIILIFVFGGIQGVRGLASLIGSFILIFFLLIPSIYAGHNVIFVSIGVSSIIIIVGSYITHGFNRTTTSAVFGMILTVIVTGALAYYFVYAAHLSGFSTEESVSLNLNTRGSIDFIGLLFGGIMIGLLGVLYDIAIGQAVTIEELCALSKDLSRIEIYKRAIRIGREHIGALINTLAIAYVGVSLPLLLFIQGSNNSIFFLINNEVFSTEIIRILIGSIGLILGVPITTLISSYMLYGKVSKLKKVDDYHHHH